MNEPRSKKPRHEEKDRKSGKYKKSRACDCCGKPVGTFYITDVEVCGTSDGPGFWLCDRKKCIKKRVNLTVAERGSLYAKTREETEERALQSQILKATSSSSLATKLMLMPIADHTDVTRLKAKIRTIRDLARQILDEADHE